MIYIQSNKERTLPHHFDAACAMYGAMDLALDYRLTSFEEIMDKPMIWNSMVMKNNVFIGSVEFMREVFKRAGKTDVRLPMNSDRPSEIITLGEAHKRVAAGEKLFVKPVEIKLFTGLVLDGCVYSCLKGLPDDTKVMAYKPFSSKILSEWRLYIHNDEIIDARNYSGDFRIAPDYNLNGLKDMRNIYKFPCAYTIDIGILEDRNQNVVIEFNDGWSFGNYGLPNDIYLKMLMDRYFEIVK